MRFNPKVYHEILMEGRKDDGVFGRGPFDRWVQEGPLNYGERYLVRKNEAISLAPSDGNPVVFEQYGTLNAGRKLNGALTISGGACVIPPNHPPMAFRKQNCEEALYIIDGAGRVEVEDETYSFHSDNAVFLPAWAKHRITNTGDRPLKIFWAKGIALTPFEAFGYIEGADGQWSNYGGYNEGINQNTMRSTVKYWKMIVVDEQSKIAHFSADGSVAKSPGQQGFNYITPGNVGSLTIRLVGGKGPANLLDKVKDPRKEFTMTWHNTEEIHYYISGSGLFVVDDYEMEFHQGDTILTPARSKHQGYPYGKDYLEMCATGVRFRPFEGLTESGIDQREYMED